MIVNNQEILQLIQSSTFKTSEKQLENKTQKIVSFVLLGDKTIIFLPNWMILAINKSA